MPPRPRPKRRWRVLAIAATVCATLSAAAWGVSVRWDVNYTRTGPRVGLVSAACHRGILVFAGFPAVVTSVNGWKVGEASTRPLIWWPRWPYKSAGVWSFFIPLWFPTAACALVALAFWRIDTLHSRRSRAGACPACTYDRTGLPAAAACPECGAAAPAPPPRPRP